jgi:hypothetical protein
MARTANEMNEFKGATLSMFNKVVKSPARRAVP